MTTSRPNKPSQSSRDSAEQLRDPVTERRGPRHMAAADQTEGHSRIQLATRNMQGSRNKGGDRETVSKGDSDDVVPSGFNRANSYEDQRERSNEFGEQRAKFSHDVMQSDLFRVDNSVRIGASHRLAAIETRTKMSI